MICYELVQHNSKYTAYAVTFAILDTLTVPVTYLLMHFQTTKYSQSANLRHFEFRWKSYFVPEMPNLVKIPKTTAKLLQVEDLQYGCHDSWPMKLTMPNADHLCQI